eukprot:15469806-Alexandrium_andersonii.AAC.1
MYGSTSALERAAVSASAAYHLHAVLEPPADARHRCSRLEHIFDVDPHMPHSACQTAHTFDVDPHDRQRNGQRQRRTSLVHSMETSSGRAR